MRTCINLIEVFGDKYRVSIDRESAEGPRDKDPWLQEIRCQGRGVTIYPHGGSVLAIEVDRRPSIAAKLTALEDIRLHQDGDTEKTFLFDVSLFERVARIVKPKRRRMLTESQLQVLAKHAFQCRDGAQKSSLKRAQTPQADNFITQGELARRT
jgi:hypothetical protein